MSVAGIVVTAYVAAYPEPMTFHAAEVVRIIPKETEWPGWLWCVTSRGDGRWVPQQYLTMTGADTAIMKCEYSSTELTVAEGDELLAGKEEADWFWCTNRHGQSGWVPKSCLRFA